MTLKNIVIGVTIFVLLALIGLFNVLNYSNFETTTEPTDGVVETELVVDTATVEVVDSTSVN
jgi:hypothetical protein